LVDVDVENWLGALGLERYNDAFRENEIDFDSLRHISEDDLKEIGVALGPRRKILAAIVDLPEAGAAKPDNSTAASTATEADRRQLTVMFCASSDQPPCRRVSIPRTCAKP